MNKRKWSDDDIQFLKNNYSTSSIEFLTNNLNNRSWENIRNKASEFNIKRHTSGSRWRQEEDDFLKKYYNAYSKNFIIKELKRGWTGIEKRANFLKLKRSKSKANITLFDTWSNEMAYILGFIAADGCIIENPKRLIIKLAIKDKDHLCKINNILSPNNSIYIGNEKGFGIARLTLGSNYVCDKLIELGITPKKSLTLKFPDVPKIYRKDFIRGYFDGDGTIYQNNTTWQLKLLGTIEFLTSVNEIINSELNISLKNIAKNDKNSNIYSLRYSTYDAHEISKWMYKNSSLYLERKFDLFKLLALNKGLINE